MTTKDVLALALEALEHAVKWLNVCDKPKECMPLHAAITAIKQAQEPKVKLIPTAEEMGAPMQLQYSLDADPQGIRARVVSAVIGAMAYGARGANKPPEGHWLSEVWDIARNEAAQQAQEPLSDDECDKLADQAMDGIAEVKGMHALDLNPNILEHHTLRRELIRVGAARGIHPAPKQAEPQIHCPEKLKKGGCQLHNLHCGWPKCNAAPTPPEAA